MTTDRPGSPAAVARGCTCPVEDNHNGAGRQYAGLRLRHWMVDGTCPLHGYGAESPKEEG